MEYSLSLHENELRQKWGDQEEIVHDVETRRLLRGRCEARALQYVNDHFFFDAQVSESPAPTDVVFDLARGAQVIMAAGNTRYVRVAIKKTLAAIDFKGTTDEEAYHDARLRPWSNVPPFIPLFTIFSSKVRLAFYCGTFLVVSTASLEMDRQFGWRASGAILDRIRRFVPSAPLNDAVRTVLGREDTVSPGRESWVEYLAGIAPKMMRLDEARALAAKMKTREEKKEPVVSELSAKEEREEELFEEEVARRVLEALPPVRPLPPMSPPPPSSSPPYIPEDLVKDYPFTGDVEVCTELTTFQSPEITALLEPQLARALNAPSVTQKFVAMVEKDEKLEVVAFGTGDTVVVQSTLSLISDYMARAILVGAAAYTLGQDVIGMVAGATESSKVIHNTNGTEKDEKILFVFWVRREGGVQKTKTLPTTPDEVRGYEE